jgi:hypothetical protein
MASVRIIPELASSPVKNMWRLSIRGSILMLVVLFFGIKSFSQGFTVVNNSKATVFFQIFGTTDKMCEREFPSVPAAVEPRSRMVYRSATAVNWRGDNGQTGLEFSGFKASYSNPSGACTANAAGVIGISACRHTEESTINTAECDGTAGELHLNWSVKNGNVTVTIN